MLFLLFAHRVPLTITLPSLLVSLSNVYSRAMMACSLVNINVECLGSQEQEEVVHRDADQDLITSPIQRSVWLAVDLWIVNTMCSDSSQRLCLHWTR